MEQPLVSICMSCYNHEKYVRQALESAINQTYPNIEILISDDGSTDRSRDIILEIIKEHPDKVIKTFFSETNTAFGVVEDMYQSFEGKYIAGFSADDYWGETTVETYVTFMEEYGEYAACFCEPEIVLEATGEVQIPEFWGQGRSQYEMFRLLFMEGNRICAPSMFVRGSVWKEMGSWKFQYKQLQDYEIWLRILQKYDMYFFKKGEVPVYYRVHGNNLSHASGENIQRNLTEIAYILFEILEQMEYDFFMKAFGSQFVYAADSERFCLTCEKLMVLIHAPVVPLNCVILYYFTHIGDPDFSEHIEKDYLITRKDLWDLTGELQGVQMNREDSETVKQCLETIERQNELIDGLMDKVRRLSAEATKEAPRKRIIVITDSVHSSMVQRSIGPDVEVVLFLDFENYLAKSPDELEQDKQVLSEQLREYAACVDEIDFVFSFIQRNYMPDEEELADWVLNELREKGYPAEKVLDGWRIYRSFYPKEKYARILSNPQIGKLDGIVLGISHAEAGIRSSLLPGRAANFASSSQDLYFNYFTAQKIWEEYPDKVSDLKYVVIDMFDYTYFNFESMLTGATIDFFRTSGLDCPETFNDMGNKNISQTAEEMNAFLRTQWPHSNSYERGIFQQTFGDVIQQDENAYCDYPLVDRTRKVSIDKIEEYSKNPNITAVQAGFFEESIERNTTYLLCLLEFLTKKNPGIKIFLCLLPKYKDVEAFEISQFAHWKKFFENVLDRVQKKYPFVYLNYKEDYELSGNADYYWDLTYLNYDGSVYFTKQLAEDICKYLGESEICTSR